MITLGQVSTKLYNPFHILKETLENLFTHKVHHLFQSHFSAQHNFMRSTKNFIFSLNRNIKMMSSKRPEYGSFNFVKYGPTFGAGHDLYLVDNCHSMGSSYTNLGNSYQLPSNYKYGGNAKTMLAGTYNFKCSEYEVYFLATASQRRAFDQERERFEKQNKRLKRSYGESLVMKGQSLKMRMRLYDFIRGISGPKKEWTRCYRASNHSFRVQNFHYNCNNKGPTITLVRSGRYIFGGYNPLSWDCKYLV